MKKPSINDANLSRWSHGEVIRDIENAGKLKNLLNKTGCGFCLAKWTQVTMHLGIGTNHSCHHPKDHPIIIDEIKNNPAALHNTNYKKDIRKQMLQGSRPTECDYCWRVEDNTNELSDRAYKSLENWSINDHDEIVNMTGDEDFYPRYVEISFSNACNFKCVYCGPNYSSRWHSEIEEHGVYKLPDDSIFNPIEHTQIREKDDNPYINAFWQWFPEAVKHMHTFRITGGEPLMNKSTMAVVDYLLENPHPNLEFSVNTNGNPPGKVFKKFTDKINIIIKNNHIKKFTLFISAESIGSHAEFSRFGMNWLEFTNNIEYFLKNTENTRITFMSAFNILALPTFKNFLQYVLELKFKYNRSAFFSWLDEAGLNTENSGLHYNYKNTNLRDENADRIGIDIPYIRHPKFLDANILTIDMAEKYLIPAVDFMFRNRSCSDWDSVLGFSDWEVAKLKRICVDVLCMLKDATNKDQTSKHLPVVRERANFYKWSIQNEKRRNISISKSMPELKDFLSICKKEYDKLYE
tara:strand:- start:14 stop:1576 length:1563 start_codon:yes stop_codon:yes gene_type:complete